MEIGTDYADTPSVCLQRADLLRILSEQLPADDLHLGQEHTEIQPAGEKLRLRFTNGGTFFCDGLVGADGIYSQVRSMSPGTRDPQSRGYVIFRAIANAPKGLDPGQNSETWGSGKRFDMLSISRSKVCWYATANTFDAQLTGEKRKLEMLRMFNGWHRPIQI
jgi:2-polyprenyl-6-methoxyphenol hydroxylase-like FAD-dependent oxidoreductase